MQETILALSSASPDGLAPRGILRLSGSGAWGAARAVLPGLPLAAGYHAGLALPLVHARYPCAAALLFRGPRSFTGEDIAELHLPGSPAILAAATDALLRVEGVRAALPGEFTARAFLNGKMDLTEAEGIAATIHATDQLERRAAASLRNGHLHKEIDSLANLIADQLALIEAGIDFSDEEGVTLVGDEHLLHNISGIQEGVRLLLACAARADRLHTLPAVVFIGQPNVGKSSLINALAGTDRSITSPIAGTTRDILSVLMRTPQGDIRLMDVPGEEAPTDELRQKMMAARQQALLEADLIVEVLTDPHEPIASFVYRSDLPAYAINIQNKADLLPSAKRRTFEADDEGPIEVRFDWQLVSATTGLNLDKLRHQISDFVMQRRGTVSETLPAITQRHRALLHAAYHELEATFTLTRHPELLASHFRHALDLLGQITGAISPDEILGRIFSTFCIGK